jgi:hypothetical protein
MQTTSLLRAILLALTLAVAGLLLPPAVLADGDHHDAEGLVLRQGGVDIVTVWEGVVFGEIEVHHGETTAPIAVFFLDDDGDEFVPDDPDFSLGWVIGDETLIVIDLVGDWVFTVTGHLEGTTTLTLMLMHDGHADFMSPPIELAVTTTTDAPGVPQQVALLANHPNPFNPATALRFNLPQTAGVHLAIHDAAGKRVRTLLAGEMRPAGAHAVTWDGRDDAGRTVAAGVYVSRLLVAGESHTRTMVLVK